MEPIAAIGVLSKLIGLGMKGLGAVEAGGFGKKDIEALQSLLDTGSGIAAMHAPSPPDLAAQHLALVARSFGLAVGRHQRAEGMLRLNHGIGRWFHGADQDREHEIELRVKIAALQPARFGADPRSDVELVASLTGSPLHTSYYRRLWHAFSDPNLTLPGEEPPLVMSHTARRQFECYFVLAYTMALESPAGRAVADFLDNLQSYRALRVQEMLLQDLATWGGRHVFGNVPRHKRDPDDPVPFLALDELFVEPTGSIESRAHEITEPEPILGLIERLTSPDEPRRVVVIAADFGSGKSITARMLARRWAERALSATTVVLDQVLPIYVRCAEDFSQEAADLNATVRRAWKRQADNFEMSIPDDDISLAWPGDGQRIVCLLDGLDEIALGDKHQKTLFQKLKDKTTTRQRFVVFSRPGAIPPRSELGDHVVVVRVQPFAPAAVEHWIDAWNRARPGGVPLTRAMIDARGLGGLVKTPILLFMVAFTWQRHAATEAPPTLAEIYESFFVQIAAGKAAADRERHEPIARASEALLAALRNRDILDEGAEPADAMLWLMARVAWESQKLDQRIPPETLTRRHVDNLLHDGDFRMPDDAGHAIQVGLVLALQSDLRTANHPILFGHQSFREALIGRHWATHLHRLVRGKAREWDARALELAGARLLGDENRSLDFLMQIVNANVDSSRAASPIAWTNHDRNALVEWAQDAFTDASQRFTRADRTSVTEDERAVLREAALAIGSLTKGSMGLRAPHPTTLRTMLAWHWARDIAPRVIAPRADLRRSLLTDAPLLGAVFDGASLDGARLVRAMLNQSSLVGTKLTGAVLDGAHLQYANFRGAILRGAQLRTANLSFAELHRANLDAGDLSWAVADRANFVEANLTRACMISASAPSSDFSGAVLDGADLTSAVLTGAKFINTRLLGAQLCDAAVSGAKLRDAHLARADLTRANLTAADLRGTNLETAVLDDTDLHNAQYDDTTIWPDGFDPAAHGAVLTARA